MGYGDWAAWPFDFLLIKIQKVTLSHSGKTSLQWGKRSEVQIPLTTGYGLYSNKDTKRYTHRMGKKKERPNTTQWDHGKFL